MKTSHAYQPAAQLLKELTQKSSGTQEGVHDNDSPAEKSRWTKWKLTNENNPNSLSYCRMEKSESTLFGRLADRLNYWSGNARCAARNKIIQELKGQGIEITEDIKKALPDRWKLGNTHLLESGIKAAAERKEKALKDYCQSELAEPFRKYLWGVVKGDVASVGYPMTPIYKSIEEKITEKIATILEPQLNFFIDSLLISLSEQKKPLSKEIIEKFTETHTANFLLSVFSSPEVKAVEDQISSAHAIVGTELQVKNGKFKRTDTMPRLNPSISDKLIEKVIGQRAENIFAQRALGESLPDLERISGTLGTDECTRIFCLISETLTRQIKQIEAIRGRQKFLANS